MSDKLVTVVVLQKTDGVLGGDSVGSKYRMVLRNGRAEQDAKHRAYQMLKRDKPNENPMCWTVKEVS